MINDVAIYSESAAKISPLSSRSVCLRRRLGVGPSGLVRNNGWRDRCADAVGEPCRGPTAPAVLATRLGDYDTTALPTVFPVSAGNYQRTRSDFGGNPGAAPARRTKEQRRTRYSCDRRYRRKSF